MRSVTTVSQNGVSGFHYLQEWRRGESSGAAPASAPTRAQIPSAVPGARECGFAQGSGVPLPPLTGLQLPGHHSQWLKSSGVGRSREKLFFKGDWIPSAVRVLRDLLLE